VIIIWIKIFIPKFVLISRFYGEIEMKELKEYIQDKKGKLECPNTHSNSPKPSRGTCPNELILTQARPL